MTNQDFIQMSDGTEVLKTKDSKAKLRRWSYQAHVRVKPDLPTALLKLETMSYGSAKQARAECLAQAEALKQSPALAASEIVVKAIPHETISIATLNQVNGFRDMASILDLALTTAIESAQRILSGDLIGAEFMETPETKQGEVTIPARTLSTIKEDFYRRALQQLRSPTESST